MTAKTVTLILATILLITTACNSITSSSTLQPVESALSKDTEPPTITATNLPYFFPKQEPVEGTREAMAGETIGTLVLENNCIRINDNESGESNLLIWPPEFTLITDNDTIQILNGDDKVVAHVGDKVWIGGGEINSLLFFDESMQKKLPPNCQGPFWIVGYTVEKLETSK